MYIHTTPSGKKYVGITSRKVNERWRNGRGYDTQVFGRAVQKYGWDNIDHKVIASDLSHEEAEELEKKLIAEYKSSDPQFGYNLTEGGDGMTGYVVSEVTKERQKAQRQGSNAYGFGKHPSNFVRAKMSSSNRGRTFSKEAKEKMSIPKRKRVYQYDQDGNFLKSFDSASQASKQTGTSIGNQCSCCRRVVPKANGFFWSYDKIDDPDIIKRHLSKEELLPTISGRNRRAVIQTDHDGNEIKKYASIKEASDDTGITQQQIGYACKHPESVTGWYKWRYASD